MIRRLKLAIVFSAAAAAVIACSSAAPKRYSITDSRTYEASLFRQNCAICHGPEAEGKDVGSGIRTPNLREGEFKYKTDAQIYRHIAEGGNGMMAFRKILTEREINSLVRLVQDDLRNKQ